jgi:hypothetical protein
MFASDDIPLLVRKNIMNGMNAPKKHHNSPILYLKNTELKIRKK